MNPAEPSAAPRRSESYLEFLKEYPRTGPDTRAGQMLRRYWHPLCLSKDLKDLPYPVRMLGEDLVAFRAPDGAPGLLAGQCAHRRASLQYGQVRRNGLQCSYHGWTYDARGHCVDMPLEPAGTPLMEQVHQTWYAVQEWGGIVWCYMGPEKADPPPLPKIDILTRTDGELVVERGDIRNYSYLNFLENFADMGHVYVLHLLEPGKVPDDIKPYVNTTVNTTWRELLHRNVETSFGMKSVMVHGTADPDVKFVNTWSIALPAYFRFGGIAGGLPPDFTHDRRESGGILRIIDDTHFEIFRHTLIRPGNFRSTFYPRASDTSRGLAEGMRGTREKKDYDYRKYPAWEGRPPVEDLVLQESQGAIPPREFENLGTSDSGVVLLRKLWRKSMDSVAAGKPPKTIVTGEDGVFEVDTYKGFAKASEVRVGPENMPSSKDGCGLIRDANGALVFA